MALLEPNPFVQDVERQVRRNPRSRRSKSLAPRFCTAIVVSVVLCIFIYLMVGWMKPLGHNDSTELVTRPEIRSTTETVPTEGSNMTDNNTLSSGTMNWNTRTNPTWTASNWHTPTWTASNWSTLNWTNPTWTTRISEISTSPSAPIATVQPDSTFVQLDGTISPEIPAAHLCIPRKMHKDVFREKQLICDQCFNGNYSPSLTTASEEAHRHSCHSNCFDNDTFKQCAHTLEMILLLQAA